MSIWRNLRTVEDLNANRKGTLIANLGIVFTEIGADFVRGTMPVDTRTAQPYGLLHGGASVALAETLGSMGAGTSPPVHVGGRTHVWTIDIVNEAQKLVCISRITMAVIKRGALTP